MSNRGFLLRRILWLLVLSSVSLASHARNTKLLLPIYEVTNLPSTQQLVGTDMAFHFGAAWPEKLGSEPNMIGEAWARGVASPMQSGPMGRTETKSDEQTCREALRKALADLSGQARGRGGNGVVGIVSFYERVEMNSPSAYECHAGMTRAVVELRGRIIKVEPSLVAALQARSLVGTYGKTADGAAAGPASLSGIGSEINDTSLLPNASDRMKERYRVFLAKPLPRAFAISEGGEWWMAWGKVPHDPDTPPAERAVRDCQKSYGKPCVLYAVDNTVVYRAPEK